MMMTNMMTAMKTSISEVLETMFYLPVEFSQDARLSDAGLDDSAPVMACELGFSGEIQGKLILVVPRNLLAGMTENFMGETAAPGDDALLEGTLTETLNMICGNMLGRLETRDPLELGIPMKLDTLDSSADDMFTIIETIGAKMAIRLVVA
ncbi:MAG: chemotaxis protein CheX [Desulfobacteraceae bacterium]|mgnify:CR=1 FL=1|nr:MAG: chemotaxis protein CheX [Desulfobacteraceae bacterium]